MPVENVTNEENVANATALVGYMWMSKSVVVAVVSKTKESKPVHFNVDFSSIEEGLIFVFSRLVVRWTGFGGEVIHL